MRRMLAVVALCASCVPAVYAVSLRGDVNVDQTVNALDVFAIINHVNAGGAVALPCRVDVDTNGTANNGDAALLANFLYGQGSPPAPFPPDVPEMSFADTNCDGTDGDIDKAIFVSMTGNDAAAGISAAEPVLTINTAIQRSLANFGRNQILI